MSINHYENFPVASILCPAELRPAVAAIYWFARTADDIADEGEMTPAERIHSLIEYRAQLHAVAQGNSPHARWAHIFDPLKVSMDQFSLPVPLLDDLLDAFQQDITKHSYVDRNELLAYCRRSANPIGRLLLHLYGIKDSQRLQQADHICTALQLANFWQDLSIDTQLGRVYVPLTDCLHRGVSESSLRSRQDSPAIRRLIADMVHWTWDLMHLGLPLALAIPGRAGWELRLVVQGGLRILEKIQQLNYATLHTRPTLVWNDGPRLLWRAFHMHCSHRPLSNYRP